MPPPSLQLELAELLPPRCHRDPPPVALRSRRWDPPDDADAAGGDGLHSDIGEGGRGGCSGARSPGTAPGGLLVPRAGPVVDASLPPPPAEEIKELLAALRPSEATGDGDPAAQPGAVRDGEQDPDTEPPAVGDGGGAGVGEEEEEAQMVLAIQRSMDSTRREDEELARATALSLRSYRQEQRASPGGREEEEEEEDAGLLAALEASLEEALPAADAARVLLFSSFERDVAAAPGELERALAGRLRVEEVASERLRAMPAACRRCLAFLQRKHAVSLRLRGGTATLRGFADYAAAAARDLDLLLQRLPQPERGPPAAAHWVSWDPSGTAVPYAPAAAALLEQAWLRRERRLDLLLDGRPVTVDFERMEEYDIGSARASAVSRSRPPTESAHRLLGACRHCAKRDGAVGSVPPRRGVPCPGWGGGVCCAAPAFTGAVSGRAGGAGAGGGGAADAAGRGLGGVRRHRAPFLRHAGGAAQQDQHRQGGRRRRGGDGGGAGCGVPAAEPRTLRCCPAGGEADPPAALQAVPAEEGQHGGGQRRRRRGAGPLPRHHRDLQPRDLLARLQPQLLRQER